MAMSVASSGDADPIVDMNTTPLIDVMLVLLIMFIITLPLMTHNIKIELPQTPPGEAPKREVIQLRVDFDGTVLWNGAVIESLDHLERLMRSEASKDVQPELHVQADKRAEYDRVAQVLGRARRTGIERIGIVGND